ncbi:MAG: hypothetical protein JWQ98_3484 [Chlorobi bacterium]|nr:hypothetical protein [Chlorobiota bacterium]
MRAMLLLLENLRRIIYRRSTTRTIRLDYNATAPLPIAVGCRPEAGVARASTVPTDSLITGMVAVFVPPGIGIAPRCRVGAIAPTEARVASAVAIISILIAIDDIAPVALIMTAVALIRISVAPAAVPLIVAGSVLTVSTISGIAMIVGSPTIIVISTVITTPLVIAETIVATVLHLPAVILISAVAVTGILISTPAFLAPAIAPFGVTPILEGASIAMLHSPLLHSISAILLTVAR